MSVPNVSLLKFCILNETGLSLFSPFTVDVSSASFPYIQSENSADSSGSRQSLERWEDSDVRFADHNNGTCVKWNAFLADGHFPTKFPEFFGKWKTPNKCLDVKSSKMDWLALHAIL